MNSNLHALTLATTKKHYVEKVLSPYKSVQMSNDMTKASSSLFHILYKYIQPNLT